LDAAIDVANYSPSTVAYSKEAWKSLNDLNIGEFGKIWHQHVKEFYAILYRGADHDCESIIKHIMQSLMKAAPCLDCKMIRESTIKNSKEEVDFLFELPNRRILLEMKYKSTKKKFKEDFQQLNGYKFPPLKENTMAIDSSKVLLNLDENGLAQWYGPIKKEDASFETALFHNLREIVFICKACDPPTSFKSQTGFADHVKVGVHAPYRCPICKREFSNIIGLNNHKRACISRKKT